MAHQLWQYAKLNFAYLCCYGEATFLQEADNRLIIIASVAVHMHAKAAFGVKRGVM